MSERDRNLLKLCTVCGKLGEVMNCARCKSVKYCSVDCQVGMGTGLGMALHARHRPLRSAHMTAHVFIAPHTTWTALGGMSTGT